jgi:hypothetical protein
MLTGYFDDTGTHDASPFIGFGGLIGNEEIWYLFQASWHEKLQRPLPGKPPLKRFHMWECMNRVDEFASYSEPERDAVIHDFRQLIIASGVWGYAVGVSRPDWDELVQPSPMAGWFGDAEAFCFRDCVAKMCGFVTELSAVDKELALVFDNRPHRTEVNEFLVGQVQQIQQFTRKPNSATLIGVSFENSTKTMPLQAADMFAWEFFAHCKQLLSSGDNTPRAHAKQFFDSGRFFMGAVDRATCEKLVGLLGVRQA